MHISDGILAAPVLAGGYAAAAIVAVATMRKMDLEEIPKISVVTAVFFVASLIKVPIGPTSIHLVVNGLAGVILGWRAFAAILLGLILQALLFGHGGITVIGVNAFMLGGGGLMAYLVWQLRHYIHHSKREVVFGVLAGAAGVASSGIILALTLLTAGEAFTGTAYYVLSAHVPIMIIEGIVVGTCAGFLQRVKPEILAGQRRKTAANSS